MLTADGKAAEKAEAFALEADDYIVKPFVPRDLVSRITAAIRRRSEADDEVAERPAGDSSGLRRPKGGLVTRPARQP